MEWLRSLLLVLTAVPATVDAQRFNWVEPTASGGFLRVGMAMADDGSLYILHNYAQSFTMGGATIDPIGAINLTLTKLDPEGNHVWSSRFGGGGGTTPGDVALDAEGNVYASMTLDMNTVINDDTTYSTGGIVHQVVKVDPEGHFVRTRFFTASMPALATEGNDLYLAYGSTVERCDTALTTLWTRSVVPANITFTFNNTSSVLAVRGDRVLVGGYENAATAQLEIDTVTFAFGGSGTSFDQYGLIMLDTTGTALWARVSDGNNGTNELLYEAFLDESGNVYAIGQCQAGDPVSFAGSTYSNPLGGSGSYPMLVKYGPDGEELWARPIGASVSGIGYDVHALPSGAVFITGRYVGDLLIDDFPGAFSGTGYFIARVDPQDGSALWMKHGNGEGNRIRCFGGPECRVAGFNSPNSAFDCLGPVNIAGVFAAATDEGTAVEPVAGFTYSFSDLDYQFTSTSTGADEYLWDFGDGTTSTDPSPLHTYTTGGPYQVTLTAINGVCTDVITELILSVGTRPLDPNGTAVAWPIPTNDHLFVKVPVGVQAISVLGSDGRWISDVFVPAGVDQIQLPVRDLSEGTYVLRLIGTDSSQLLRFMVAGDRP